VPTSGTTLDILHGERRAADHSANIGSKPKRISDVPAEQRIKFRCSAEHQGNYQPNVVASGSSLVGRVQRQRNLPETGRWQLLRAAEKRHRVH
jgi:hypothetical protein